MFQSACVLMQLQRSPLLYSLMVSQLLYTEADCSADVFLNFLQVINEEKYTLQRRNGKKN